jgi:hypothetical protein
MNADWHPHGAIAIASARPVKVGGSLICIEVDVHNDAGKHCVRITQMLAFRDAGQSGSSQEVAA